MLAPGSQEKVGSDGGAREVIASPTVHHLIHAFDFCLPPQKELGYLLFDKKECLHQII